MLWLTILVLLGLLVGLTALTFVSIPGKMLAIAQATYRETTRQLLFWILLIIFAVLLCVSVFIPYFTLGEDLKVMKDIGLDAVLLPTLVITVLMSALSISEEIEGRTAVTLLSKPVSRRQFLLGKFFGTLLAGLLMMAILSIILGFMVQIRYDMDRADRPADTADVAWAIEKLSFLPGVLLEAVQFVLRSFAEIQALGPGLVLGFCQVMILTSVAVALATRLPMVVNILICFVVFFMGRLTHVLETQSKGNALVNFVAQVFQTLLPGLNYYDVGPAIVSEVEVPWGGYVLPAAVHGMIYTTIALVFGLILFEDRDLA